MTRSPLLASIVLGLFSIGLTQDLAAQPFNVPFTPSWQDSDIGFTRTDYGTSGSSAFHFGIPNYRGREPDVIRGVIVEYPGSGGTCTVLPSSYYRWLYDNGFVTMGQRGATASYSSAANAITALNSLATTLNRPELANAPLFAFGQSMGGAQSTYVAERYATCVIGFFCNHSGPQAFGSLQNLPSSNNPALTVPGYFSIADSEDTDWAYWQFNKFIKGRSFGAPWSMRYDRGATHPDFARMTSDAVMVIDAIAAARLPAVVDPRNGIVPLNPVSLTSGYLLEHRIGPEKVVYSSGYPPNFNLWRDFDSTHLEIAPYAQHDCYPDRATMGWAPNLALADFWASRASTGYMTVPTSWFNAGTENALNDFGTKDAGDTIYGEVDLNGFASATAVELYNNGVLVGTVSTIPASRIVPVSWPLPTAGMHRLRATAVAADGERRLGWTMSIHARPAPANGNSRPTAVAVNNEYFKLFQQKPDGTYDPQRFYFTVNDAETAAASLVVSRSVVANGRGNVKTSTFGGSGADRWVDVTPKDNWSGRDGGLLLFVTDGTDSTNLTLSFRARPATLQTPTRRNSYSGFNRPRPLAVTGPYVTELNDDGSDFSDTTYSLTMGADATASEAPSASPANAQSFGYGNWFYSRIKMTDTANPSNVYSSLSTSYTRTITRPGAPDLKSSQNLNVYSARPAHAPIVNYPADHAGFVGLPTRVTLRLDEMSMFRDDIPVTVTSSNPAVLPPAGITTSTRGIDEDRILSLTPVSVGTTTITVTASDDSTPPLVTTRSFVLTAQTANGSLALTPATLTLTEGNSGSTDAAFTVTRTSGSLGAISVTYATANGTATAGSDYTATSGILSWADGDDSAKTIAVPILGDTVAETNETFTLTLSAPTGGAALGNSSASITITDDEPAPALSVTSGGDPISNNSTLTAPVLNPGVAQSFTYTLANTGNGPLTLGAASLTGTTNATATITSSPASSVANGASTTVVIRVTPTAAGPWQTQISVPSNDLNAPTFSWTLSGTALSATSTLSAIADRSSQGSDTSGNATTESISLYANYAIKFSVPSTAPSEATLRIYRAASSTSLTLSAFQVGDDWTESASPSSSSSLIAAAPAGTGGQWVEIDVTAYVQAQATSDQIASFLVKSDVGGWTSIHSRENSVNPPELILIFPPPTSPWDNWTSAITWNGADSSPTAIVSPLGLTNLMLYALDITDPFASDTTKLPALGVDITTPGGPWITFTYRMNQLATDLTYRLEFDDDLTPPWSNLVIDNVDVFKEIADPDPDGDGSSKLIRIRLKDNPSNTPRRFLQLKATQ